LVKPHFQHLQRHNAIAEDHRLRLRQGVLLCSKDSQLLQLTETKALLHRQPRELATMDAEQLLLQTISEEQPSFPRTDQQKCPNKHS